jgi:hypothetical protein
MATRKQCEQALDQYEGIMNKKNVVGMGIVSNAPNSSGLAVAVYVEKMPMPMDEADMNYADWMDMIPPTLLVGTVMVPTKVIEQGKVELETIPE